MSYQVDAAVLQALTLHLAGRHLHLVAVDRRDQVLGEAKRRAIDLLGLLHRLGVYQSRPMTVAGRPQVRRLADTPDLGEWAFLILAVRDGPLEVRQAIDATLWELPEYRHGLADKLAALLAKEHRKAQPDVPSEPD